MHEKSTTISVRLQVVTLMWHMMYMRKKRDDDGWERKNEKEESKCLYTKVHAFWYFLSRLTVIIFTYLYDHSIRFLNCRSILSKNMFSNQFLERKLSIIESRDLFKSSENIKSVQSIQLHISFVGCFFFYTLFR
jgi:hypothetical protein